EGSYAVVARRRLSFRREQLEWAVARALGDLCESGTKPDAGSARSRAREALGAGSPWFSSLPVDGRLSPHRVHGLGASIRIENGSLRTWANETGPGFRLLGAITRGRRISRHMSGLGRARPKRMVAAGTRLCLPSIL